MCDTFIALPKFTNNGSLIFGKNSDREPNEAQDIVSIPRKSNLEPSLKCTYISIPQVPETFQIIISKPFWMWGAEMGVNEHGLVIGNEAVFTKIKIKKENTGLTGMDLLRLALERTKTAKDALDLIVTLLEKHSQNACGGYTDKNFYYHNSFIIADKTEAWILETADIHWIAKKINMFGSISNGLSIETDFDLVSENCINFALKKGWHKAENPFNFAKSYSSKFMNWASSCQTRQNTTATKANINRGNFEIFDAMNILKSHHEMDFIPSNSTTKDVCMHATGLLSPSHTVGSMVFEIREKGPATIWLTGSSNPCLSFFKPVYMGSNFDFTISNAKPNDSFWWKCEAINRKAIKNYSLVKNKVEEEFIRYQKYLIYEDESIVSEINSTPFVTKEQLEKLNRLTKEAFEFHDEMNLKNIKLLYESNSAFAPFFNQFWKNQNNVFN
jgi:dipeptidase